jgi:ferredoxin
MAQENHIIIDTYECNGCGACAEICADVFRLNEFDHAELIDSEAVITAQVEEAAAYCAQKCITFA